MKRAPASSKAKPTDRKVARKPAAPAKTAAKKAAAAPPKRDAKQSQARPAAKKSTVARATERATPKRAATTKTPKASPARAAAAPGRSAKERAEIAARLARAVPDPVCELRFSQPWELLIATILSAQSTDKMVNAVMPGLLARYPSPRALAEAAQEDVEEVVKRTGFFRNKAKAIRGAAQHLIEHHGGEVPKTLEELVEVPGVARKTANVVLGTAYRIASGFIVDTHVTRVSQRLALSGASDPVRIEQDLCGGFPQTSWVDLGHRLVLHGRYTCLAKRPDCACCALNELCPSRLTVAEERWATRADREAEKVAAQIRDHTSVPAISTVLTSQQS